MGDDEYDRRHAALHQGTRLEWFTVFWNVIEVFVTVTLGLMAGSLALVAYGLDSVIEVFASLVVVRYISRHESGGQAARRCASWRWPSACWLPISWARARGRWLTERSPPLRRSGSPT